MSVKCHFYVTFFDMLKKTVEYVLDEPNEP